MKPISLFTAMHLLAAVLLASATVAPAAAATRYLGLIGASGTTAAPSADIGERLQRINMLGYGSSHAGRYGTGALAAGSALLGSIGTDLTHGNGRGEFAFEGAGLTGAAAGLRTPGVHGGYGGSHYAYDGYGVYDADGAYAAPARGPYGNAGPAMGEDPPVSGLPASGEPASLTMLVAGLGLLGMIARRRTFLR